MTGVSFGIFDWVDRGTSPLHELYEERLRVAEAADAAGFFCYHVAEHHATPLGMAPSPALFLTALAQRTRRIHLGPLGALLPLYDPLRLIEEVCMLDQISGGRLELGVSRGVSPYELGCFGVDAARSRPVFEEALAVLVAGLTGDRLDFKGEHYRYESVPIELQPFQRPYPPLWYPTRNPESVVYAARHGYNVVSGGPVGVVRPYVESYWRTWETHRNDPGRLSGHVTEPKFGALRQVIVADTDEAALALARDAHATWYRSITKLWHAYGDHQPDTIFNWDFCVEHETLIFGSPARVREQFARFFERSGCNYVACAFSFGTLPHAHALHSLRLFAEEVMPAFVGTPARAS